jgi:Zn-dependent protease with chaperone function
VKRIVHELAHVRRGDWVSQCFARAICALYWFHPLVWVAWRQLQLEAERACDDAVLACAEATDYANQLVGLAKRLSSGRGARFWRWQVEATWRRASQPYSTIDNGVDRLERCG